MGQDWELVSPSTGDTSYICMGNLGGWMFDGFDGQPVAELFVVPSRSDQDPSEIPNTEDKRAPSPASSQRGHSIERRSTGQRLINSDIIGLTQTRAKPVLSSLPVELHNFIFQELGIRDVIHPGFTSRYFWIVGQRHIQNFFVSLLGPWAGESFICLDDALLPDADLPEVLTEAEEAVVRRVLCRGDNHDDLGSHLRHELTYHMFGPEPYRNYMSMRWAVMSAMSCVPTPDLSRFYSLNEPWILRNLTTKEYVRSEAIALKPEYIHGPHIDALGFGEVIISRTCWSTNSSVSAPYEGGPYRGIWAGHRFDIRTLASHEKLTKAEEKEWNDISEEVIKEIGTIGECKFGSDWRRLLIEWEDGIRDWKGKKWGAALDAIIA